MATPEKPKRDLFASAEDDLKQFWRALSRGLRAAPRAIAKRVRQIGQATKPLNGNEKDRIREG
jgi:hypothetical protein